MNERDLAAQVVAEVKKAVVGKDSNLMKLLGGPSWPGPSVETSRVAKSTLALALWKGPGTRFLPGCIHGRSDALDINSASHSTTRRVRFEYQSGGDVQPLSARHSPGHQPHPVGL